MKNKSRHGATMKAIELVNKYKKKTHIEFRFLILILNLKKTQIVIQIINKNKF